MKTAVVYCRYSCDKQNEMSIEGQLDVCSHYANNNGYEIANTYIDRAMSGRNDNRDAFQQMIHDSSKHIFDAVIVYKLDRFSRNQYESVIYRKRLEDNGVELISAIEPINDKTPESELLTSLLVGLSAYYSKELAQKITRSIKILKNEGKFTGGKTTFGYDIVDQKYVPNADAEKVKAVFDAVVRGDRILDIQNSDTSLPNIHKIIRNIVYKGSLQFKGKEIPDVVPALVTKNTWDSANYMLDVSERKNSYRPAYGYALSGKIFCGYCGTLLTGESAKSGLYHYYKPKCHCISRCTCSYVEDAIVDAVSNLLADNVNIKQIAEKTIEQLRLQNGSSNLANLEKELKKTNALWKRKWDFYCTTDNESILPALMKELDQISFHANDIQKQIDTVTQLSVAEKDIINYFNGYLKSDDFRSAVLHDLVTRVEVYKNELVVYLNNGTAPPGGNKKSSSNKTGGSPIVLLYELIVCPNSLIVCIKTKN